MEMKFYWNNNSHLTKMAAIPVYGKIPLKIVYPEPEEWLQGYLECSMRDSSPS